MRAVPISPVLTRADADEVAAAAQVVFANYRNT
jgi:hypothetical protein